MRSTLSGSKTVFVTGNPINIRVAANVRAEMARYGVSQTSLAKAINRSQQALSRRLCGQVAFDVAELEAVAGAVGVPLGTLLADSQPALTAESA